MSGILPFASAPHPVWTPVANEIQHVIWHLVGVGKVQGYVRDWARAWTVQAKCSAIEQEVQNALHGNAPNWSMEWHPVLPSMPLPPSSDRSLSVTEKWASLAAVYDVYGFNGDKVLPWPLPEDDKDLVAFAKWMRGDGGVYHLLMRRAADLPETFVDTVRAVLLGLSPTKKLDLGRAKPNRVQTPEEAKSEAKLIAFLEEYESWQAGKKADTGRKRLAPRDWLKDRKSWSQSSKRLLESRCREIDGTEEEVLKLTLGAARKAKSRRNKREQSKD